MRSAIIAAAAFSALVSAGNDANAFNNPPGGYIFTSGESTTLSWDPSTSGTVSLRLQWGSVTTADSGDAVASNIDNSGSFTWDVPTDLVKDRKYSIEIIDDSDADDYNFLPYFTVAGATEAASATSSAATSTSTSEPTTTTSSSSTSSSSSSSSTSTSTSTSTTSSSSTSTSATPTTMTTMTTTSSSSSSSSASSSATPTSTSSTSASASASASSTSVPTNAAGINRVSGGMLAMAAGAAMLL